MKIQELAIIFIIIILPISLLLSEYTKFQIQTIKMQTVYDSKLTAATHDAIKAFQLNSTNSTESDLANSEMRDIVASVNTFMNSIKATFNLNGYSEDEINNYIPALVYTLYDGFYIYSPYENKNNGNDGDGQKLYGIKPYIQYSCRYNKGNVDVVITYTLDNYITVQGMINNTYVNKSGYLIEGITINSDIVKYNGIEIKDEELKEYLPLEGREGIYSYAKINGTKYYLIPNYSDGKDCIVYNFNGKLNIQAKQGDSQFETYKKWITNNQSAKQYYKEALSFTDWFKNRGLEDLRYKDAYDEVILDDGTCDIKQIWPDNDKKIFEFGGTISIENELSSFNLHRLDVIKHKLETNLAIAISNYNAFSGVENVFQMPKLKETEWQYLTHNISLISFLQGLNIGGKAYNGYSIVTNSETDKVISEKNIYILCKDNSDKTMYCRIGDNEILTSDVNISAENYATNSKISAGRLNLEFEREKIIDNGNTTYYYPLKDYYASYNSVVMQYDVTTYDDIYQYIKGCSNNDLKKAFYTALGRERASMYLTIEKINNI